MNMKIDHIDPAARERARTHRPRTSLAVAGTPDRRELSGSRPRDLEHALLVCHHGLSLRHAQGPRRHPLLADRLSVKFVVCAHPDKIAEIREWLAEIEGRWWLTGQCNIATDGLEKWFLTFSRDAAAMSFYLRWYSSADDVYVGKRYERK